MPKKYHSRKFLNKTSGIACIEINAENTSTYFDCSIVLSDCNRRIDLDLCMWDVPEVTTKMNKLNLIIDELTKLRAYLEVATEEYKEARKDKKKYDL